MDEEIKFTKVRRGFIRRFIKIPSLSLSDAINLFLGIACATLGLKGFIIPNHFLDGGAVGISLIVNQLTKIDTSLLIIIINLPFILISYKLITPAFCVKSIFGIAVLAITIAVIDFPVLTKDPLLIAVFGGLSLGAGIGFAIRGGGVIDGTEVLAVYLSRKLPVTVGDVILFINIVIFGIAAAAISVETAMYATLTYLTASKMAQIVINGWEENIALTIVSRKHDQIRDVLTNQCNMGVTQLKGGGGYGSTGPVAEEMNVLYVVVTRLDVKRILATISAVDERVFITQTPVNDTVGGMIKRKAH